jgi:hypothetical protein
MRVYSVELLALLRQAAKMYGNPVLFKVVKLWTV